MNQLIISDSRGKGLKEHLESIYAPTVFLKAVSGADTSEAFRILKHTYNIKQYNLIVIAVGICDLTSKMHTPNGVELVYDRPDDIVSSVCHSFSQIKAFVQKHGIHCKIVTIPSASLKNFNKSSQFKNELTTPTTSDLELKLMQNTLENHLLRINMFITDLNDQSNLRTVHWDKDLQKSSLKRKSDNTHKNVLRFVYKDFHDGVHPCDALRTRWYTVLLQSISKDLSN